MLYLNESMWTKITPTKMHAIYIEQTCKMNFVPHRSKYQILVKEKICLLSIVSSTE